PVPGRAARFADAAPAPAGILQPPPTCESAAAQPAWPFYPLIPAGASTRCAARSPLCSAPRARRAPRGGAAARFVWPTRSAKCDSGFSGRTARENSPRGFCLRRCSNPSARRARSGNQRKTALPPLGDKKADPALYIREKGAEEYQQRLKEAPSYVDYLISRARQMDLSTGEGKSRAEAQE